MGRKKRKKDLFQNIHVILKGNFNPIDVCQKSSDRPSFITMLKDYIPLFISIENKQVRDITGNEYNNSKADFHSIDGISIEQALNHFFYQNAYTFLEIKLLKKYNILTILLLFNS